MGGSHIRILHRGDKRHRSGFVQEPYHDESSIAVKAGLK